MDEYLYAIREIEGRIQKAEQANTPRVKPTIEVPSSSVPEHYTEHSRLMFDLMTAAFQTDSTRVITFQMAIEQSNRAYREIGISDSHHGLTHHGGDKEKIEKCIKINRYEVEQFAYFIGKLKSHSGRRRHSVRPHHGDLRQRPGPRPRSRQPADDSDRDAATACSAWAATSSIPDETPLANLHLTMAQQMGVPAESFADSTGKLRELTRSLTGKIRPSKRRSQGTGGARCCGRRQLIDHRSGAGAIRMLRRKFAE